MNWARAMHSISNTRKSRRSGFQGKNAFIVLAILVVSLVSSGNVFAQPQGPISQIAQLNAEGRSAEAYNLAIQQLAQLEGEPAFDLHYGVAAVDTGRASEGAFALERVLMNQPTNDYARLELGRAYFALEEDDRAEREFNQVLASNPPQEVVQNVQPYLRAIDNRRSKRETTIVANVELGSGYDSNILASPDTDTFFIPLLADDATLASSELDDVFYQFKGDVGVNHPFLPGTSFFARANMSLRENDEGFRLLDPSDPSSVVGLGRIFGYGASSGIRRERGAHNVSLSAEFNIMEIDKRGYRDSYGLRSSWRYAWSPLSSITFFGSANKFSHQDLPFKDSLMTMGGLTLQHQILAPMRPLLSIGGVLGDENAKNDDLPGALATADREIVGANASLALTPAPNWQLTLGYDISQNSYSGESLNALPSGSSSGDVFVKRNDTQKTFRLGLAWLPMDNVLLKLDGSTGQTDSNIAIFDYDRNQLIFSVRYTYR